MKVATASNSRTTHAAKGGLNKALKVAFSGGTVMGMSVVGLALLGVSVTFIVVFAVVTGSVTGSNKIPVDSLAQSVLPILAGFSLGASSIALFSFFILRYYIGASIFNGTSGYIELFLALIFGLTAGVIIGILTEFFTGTNTSPVKSIIRSSITGSATNLITGMGVGMLSSFPTLVIIVSAIYGSFAVAGLYGIGIAALGMLITLGIQLAVDAYGPIADNAGGLAVMGRFSA